ncbi:hypothetical protein FBY58_0278 [Zymomonas mobilis]|uniref:Uncharacterized protein n=1 Tax=Zymomonas mobilis TaxID=542 RepID=A0A542VZJ4_ZYMMB|nr:hypothetical protein FBY58_0278 [Zymomonas mobilis]
MRSAFFWKGALSLLKRKGISFEINALAVLKNIIPFKKFDIIKICIFVHYFYVFTDIAYLKTAYLFSQSGYVNFWILIFS